MPPVFVDAHALADRLDVTYGTILTWARRGKIPHARDGRGRLLFNVDRVFDALRLKATTTFQQAEGRGGDHDA